MPQVPWTALSETLKACAKMAIDQQRQVAEDNRIPSAIWLGITEKTLQSIDFVWLKQQVRIYIYINKYVYIYIYLYVYIMRERVHERKTSRE